MFNRKITRISVSLILVTGMILGITGCGKNAEVPNSSPDNGEPQAEDGFTAETPESFFPINEIVNDADNDTEEAAPVDSPDWVGELEAAKDANQLFVVAGYKGFDDGCVVAHEHERAYHDSREQPQPVTVDLLFLHDESARPYADDEYRYTAEGDLYV